MLDEIDSDSLFNNESKKTAEAANENAIYSYHDETNIEEVLSVILSSVTSTISSQKTASTILSHSLAPMRTPTKIDKSWISARQAKSKYFLIDDDLILLEYKRVDGHRYFLEDQCLKCFKMKAKKATQPTNMIERTPLQKKKSSMITSKEAKSRFQLNEEDLRLLDVSMKGGNRYFKEEDCSRQYDLKISLSNSKRSSVTVENPEPRYSKRTRK
jgi:hypothetical protein